MKFLLDTCVISELRKVNMNPRLKELMDSADEEDLFMSVVSIGELVKGVFLLEESRRKREISSWVNGIEKNFADRLLNIDQEIVHIWGEITAKAQKIGKIIPVTDGLIAATVLKHGLHLVTRNSADFDSTGVLIVNPWLT